MRARFVLMFAFTLAPRAIAAQAMPESVMHRPAAFASWTPVPVARPVIRDAVLVPAARPGRMRNALVGGAIGAAAGVVACTVISTIADDSAEDRISTCTWKGYLLLGSIGFAAGFGIGLAI